MSVFSNLLNNSVTGFYNTIIIHSYHRIYKYNHFVTFTHDVLLVFEAEDSNLIHFI